MCLIVSILNLRVSRCEIGSVSTYKYDWAVCWLLSSAALLSSNRCRSVRRGRDKWRAHEQNVFTWLKKTKYKCLSMAIVHALFAYWQSPFIRLVIFYFALNYFYATAYVAWLGYHHNIFRLNYVSNKSNTPVDSVSRVNSSTLFQHCNDIFWKTIKTIHATVWRLCTFYVWF